MPSSAEYGAGDYQDPSKAFPYLVSRQNAEEAAARAELEARTKELEEAQHDMAIELAQVALDTGGLVDPTPICDTLSAAISLSKGDLIGAGLSLISIVPYIGDAAAKPFKSVRSAAKIKKLAEKIAHLKGSCERAVIEYAKRSGTDLTQKISKTMAMLPKPAKGHLLDSIADKFPQTVKNTIGSILDTFGRKKLGKIFEDCPLKKSQEIMDSLVRVLDGLEGKADKISVYQKKKYSELVGMEGGRDLIARKIGLDPDSIQANFGKNTVNLFHFDPETKRCIVGEAKGGTSQLSPVKLTKTDLKRLNDPKDATSQIFKDSLGSAAKKVRDGGKNEIGQGSSEYMYLITMRMMHSKDPARRQMGKQMYESLLEGNLEYIATRTNYKIKPVETEIISTNKLGFPKD